MTWAEFRIRSFAFKRQREWEMMLARETSYEVHTLKYMFGKTKPPKKSAWWPILDSDKSPEVISEEMMRVMTEEWRVYNEKIKEKDGQREVAIRI